MIYKAYELLPALKHLVLTEIDGKIEWIGTDEQRKKVKDDIMAHELLLEAQSF
jgi:hypothetical protein